MAVITLFPQNSNISLQPPINLSIGEVGIATRAAQWGEISGTLSNQTDLQTEFDTKSDKVIFGQTSKQLVSLTQTNLGVNFNAVTGTAEQEVTGLLVTLPVIATTCTLVITHKVFTTSVAGDNSYRIRLGTSGTFSSNAVVDNLYVGGAKVVESLQGIVVTTANLSTQTYINYTYQNSIDGLGANLSASGARSTVVVQIYI